mgnify:CR=1 FL=1
MFADLIPASNGSVEWGDFDNDGDQDILQTGANDNPYTRLYRNEGDGGFEVVEAGLEQVAAGEAVFTDYDNDGDLDIVLGGAAFDQTPVTRIYRNDGSNTWVNIEAGLPGLLSLTVDAGDYDGDGDVDLVLTGSPGEFSDGQTYIYRNEGSGTFVADDQSLINVFNGDAQWGDYDNDDDLDLLVAGIDSPYGPQRFLSLYQNDGTGELTEGDNTGLPDGILSFQWGDYDNDGDLDLAAIGDPYVDSDNDGQDDNPTVPQTRIYRNDLGSEAVALSAPTSLQTQVQDNGDVTLSWQPPQSADGPVTYNLRVSTVPQNMNVLSSMTDLVLNSRLVADNGNVGMNTSWTLRELPEGEYYWSVQTIAGNQVASAFTSEHTFTVQDEAVSADLTGDGNVDVDDLLILLAVWGNYDAMPAADLTGDSAISVQDLLAMLSQWD